MKKTLLCSALLAALMSVSGGAQAALVSQGGGVVLDNVNNLLWFTDGVTVHNWNNATSWAAGLTTGSLSAGSWSLASRSQFNLLASATGGANNSEKNATLNSFGIANGEYWLAELRSVPQYDNEGNIIGSTQAAYIGVNNSYTVGAGGYYSYLYKGDGEPYNDPEIYGSLAVASYTAPAQSAVPIPAAAWLMASGLGVFGAAARRRRAKAA